MLPSSSLSKVCGHGHIKKFWLTQNQKESESTSLSAGSAPASASPWRSNGAHPTGLELSYGNVSSRACATAVRPLQISGPVCSNTATSTGHASLASCAESLSTLSWSEHCHTQTRPASFSLSSGIIKQEHRDDDRLKPSMVRVNDGATFPCDSPSESRGCRTYAGKAFDGYCPQNLLTEPSVKEDWQPEQKKTSQGNCNRMKASPDSDHLECKFLNREVQERSHTNTYSRIKSEPLVGSKSFAEDGPAVSDTIGTLPPKDKSSSKQGKVGLSASKGLARIEVFGTIRFQKCSPPRACLVCGTTETPLWRSGPEGPKSLCNACGIRLKKAKRCSELNERLGSSGSDLAITHLVKAASKAGKRKQDTIPVNPELPRTTRVLATQISKKRRGSNPMRKGEFVPQNLACSSGKISPTLSLPSPSAVPSPSVSAFEKLSIGEDSKAMNVEEEAAVSLMCLSSGLAFA